MIGPILALISGTAFAVGGIFARRGLHRSGEAYSPMAISIFSGLVVVSIWLLISGEIVKLGSLSWLGAGALIAAGIIHFALGRWFYCIGVQLIGANRAVPINACSILIAALIGVFLLGEPLTIPLVIAVLFIISGIILVGTTGGSDMGELSIPKGSLVKGVLAALVTAVCWGVSPALMKIGLKEIGSPLLAVFIAFASAAVVIGISLAYPGNIGKLRKMKILTSKKSPF